MKSIDYDYKRIAQGYKNRPFLHKEVINKFIKDIGKEQFQLGMDVGCGAGLSTRALSNVCTKVIGTDISSQMIQAAKEACAQEDNIEYIVSSAEEVPYFESQFDIVTAAGIIQWVNRHDFLKKMSEIIKEKGYLLIYDFAVSGEMIGNSKYAVWWQNEYLQKYPKPYRNEYVWKQNDVKNFGFEILNQEELRLKHTFDFNSFIEFMMIQSNNNF